MARNSTADLLREVPRLVDDLAATTGTDSPALYRLLRALASIGVSHENDERCFALTATGELLRRDHPHSIDSAAPRALIGTCVTRTWCTGLRRS